MNELVYNKLIGDDDVRAVARFRDAFDALVAAERALGGGSGIEASVVAGDGLWVVVAGDGGDAISNGSWQEILPAAAVSDV